MHEPRCQSEGGACASCASCQNEHSLAGVRGLESPGVRRPDAEPLGMAPRRAKHRTRVYILVEVECSKDVPDLTDKVAGRAYTLDGVETATALLLTTKQSFDLAEAQINPKE